MIRLKNFQDYIVNFGVVVQAYEMMHLEMRKINL